MFEQTKYIQNSFAINFARRLDIRRKSNEFEDVLKEKLEGHYGQPQVISVPDELDPEIPRLIFSSRHGFSQIIVSQISITLNVTYSPDWQLGIENGREYLLKRINVLYEALPLVDINRPYFAGLSTRVRLSSTADDRSILKYISQLFLKDSHEEKTHDIELKLTSVYNKLFFSNITIRNYRIWKFAEPQQGIIRMAENEASLRGIEVLGDFNDRYAFNEQRDYYSDSSVFGGIIGGGLAEIDRVIKKVRGASA
jgi:hypothetical protein